MFGILCASLFLLVILLIGFLFMSKTKRQHSAEIRRLTAERLSDRSRSGPPKPILEAPTKPAKAGNDNLAFIDDVDHGVRPKDRPPRHYEHPPDIHFPLPPLNRPSSSSSATSDSSLYYNKRYRDEAQNVANDPDGTLFYKKHHRKSDEIYASVAKQPELPKKFKHKKKYIGENRVGFVDESTQMVVGLNTTSPSEDSENTYAHPTTHFDHQSMGEAERIHRSKNHKLLREVLYGGDDFEVASSVIESPNEAINREIIRALGEGEQPSNGDSGSIGSFLSMASIKSFPK